MEPFDNIAEKPGPATGVLRMREFEKECRGAKAR